MHSTRSISQTGFKSGCEAGNEGKTRVYPPDRRLRQIALDLGTLVIMECNISRRHACSVPSINLQSLDSLLYRVKKRDKNPFQ